MPKNETIPKIYQTRQRRGHACLKSYPYMSKKVVHTCTQKVQLSDKVHHWTPDGPYGSKDLKFLINVPTKLPSFDVGFLIATIFGKLKLPYLPYLPA